MDAAGIPSWSVACDDIPTRAHVKDDGHECRNPRLMCPWCAAINSHRDACALVSATTNTTATKAVL